MKLRKLKDIQITLDEQLADKKDKKKKKRDKNDPILNDVMGSDEKLLHIDAIVPPEDKEEIDQQEQVRQKDEQDKKDKKKKKKREKREKEYEESLALEGGGDEDDEYGEQIDEF